MKETDELETPPWLFEWLNNSFNFTHDAACTLDNAKAGYLGTDTLSMPAGSWGKRNFLNPPYSAPYMFLMRAHEEAQHGNTTVALVKHDHSTKWWREAVEGKAVVIPLNRRIRFYLQGKPTEHAASFPSSLLLYLPKLPSI